MEDWQRKHIYSNLPKLVKLTNCSCEFLAIIHQQNLIGEDDTAMLESIRLKSGTLAQAERFYKLAVKRIGMYEALMTALEETCQAGAYHILKNEALNVFSQSDLSSTEETSATKTQLSWFKQDLFEAFQFRLKDLKWGFETININSFKFNQHGQFVLDRLSTEKSDVVSKLLNDIVTDDKDFLKKWVHACVIGNHLNMLESMAHPAVLEDIFDSNLVLLAVKYSEIPVIDFVAKFYVIDSDHRHHFGVFRDFLGPYHYLNPIPRRFRSAVLSVAAVRGSFLIMKHLLKYSFKNEQPPQYHVFAHCVINTQAQTDDEIIERKKILELLQREKPTWFHGINHYEYNPLRYQNIHVELVIFLINLGVQKYSGHSFNILHLAPSYMTPKDYDKLVRHIYSSGDSEIFHSTASFKYTPLHKAVQKLEFLDSTVEVFSSAKVDFNAVATKNITPLNLAVRNYRKEKLLDSLIRAGADIHQRGKHNQTYLHVAAETGNLTALRFLISQGCNVNEKDTRNCTPLHRAVQNPKSQTFDVVCELIKFGAHANAVNSSKFTPLRSAWDSAKKGEIENRTIELLQTAIAGDSIDAYNNTSTNKEITKKCFIKFEVRPVVAHFIGREEELSQLHKFMVSGLTQATLVTESSLIGGTGGIGKTELCSMYVQEYAEAYDGNIIWINAEKPANMSQSFRILAKYILGVPILDMDGVQEDIEQVTREVYNFFQGRKCLFVFDNASRSKNNYLEKFLPSSDSKRLHVLITSKDREWGFAINILQLEPLKMCDTFPWVKRQLGMMTEIENLVVRLQFFPLALRHATSFIKIKGNVVPIGINSYLKSFEKEFSILETSKLSELVPNDYAKLVITHLKIIINNLSSEAHLERLSLNVLNMMAYFEADKIPAEFFCFDGKISIDEMQPIMDILGKYALIEYRPQGNTVNIDRLVQSLMRIYLQWIGKEEEVLKDCLSVFKSSISRKNLNHFCCVYGYACKYINLISEFNTIPENILELLQKDLESSVEKRLGRNLLKAGEQVATERTYLNVSTSKQEPKVVKNIDTGFTICNFSEEQESELLDVKHYTIKALIFQGQVQKAMLIKLYKERAKSGTKKEDIEKIFKDLHRIVMIVNRIAIHFAMLGKYDECLVIWETLVDFGIDRRGKDDNDISVPHVLLKLALKHKNFGEVDKAYIILKKVYEKVVNFFYTEVNLTSIGYHFASTLAKKEQFYEAIQVATKVYQCRKLLLGNDHFDTNESGIMLVEIEKKAASKSLDQL